MSSGSLLQEIPFTYGIPFRSGRLYEVGLRTVPHSNWLRDLPGAHRLVQTLLQGELLGRYELLDFLIWPEGTFLRVRLPQDLSEFLRFLKDRSVPAGELPQAYWDDELQWLRLIPEDKVADSTNRFLETCGKIREQMQKSMGREPNLYFYYRNERLV